MCFHPISTVEWQVAQLVEFNSYAGEIAEKAMAATSYEEALALLVSLPVVSSNYFILAGTHGQGHKFEENSNQKSAGRLDKVRSANRGIYYIMGCSGFCLVCFRHA